MNRIIRRAAVVTVLITAGFVSFAPAPSASAGTLCAEVTAYVGWNSIPLGECVSGIGLGTICVNSGPLTVEGTGAGVLVCVPV